MPTAVAPARSVPPALSALLACALALAAAGCREPAPVGVANDPVQAVAVLNAHLRDNDLQGFARDAVPPTLRPALAAAWQAGRTRWPLEELPFDHRIPGMLSTLAADGAEARLRRSYDRQFANAHGEIRAAAEALSLFGMKYLQSDASLSPEERRHYVQLVEALGEWGAQAKLGDPKRARNAIATLTDAARRTGLQKDADFHRLGMDESLHRLGPMMAALKQTLRVYDLDLDDSLERMTLTLESREDDRARVRMRYPLAGRTIDTVVVVEQVDGHWYLSDFLRHARAAAAPLPATAPAPSPATPPPAGRRTARPDHDDETDFVIMAAIMPTSPTQPTLFEPGAAPAAGVSTPVESVPPAESATGPESDAPAPPEPTLSPAPAEPPSPAAPPRGRRPWWAGLLGKVLEPWIELRIDPLPETLAGDARPICYVLEDYGLSNALILERACREAGLPSALRPLPGDPLKRKRAYVALSRRNANSTLGLAADMAVDIATGKPPKMARPARRHSEALARLLDAHRADADLDVQLVPVSIFVGRAPDRNNGWFSVLFSENWTLVGRSRRLLAILLNGRDTRVQFATPVAVRGVVAEDLPPERTVRKLSRVLRTHFNRIREAVIGPDLSTRRLLIDKVLSAEPVKQAIADTARRENGKEEDAWKKAQAYAYEIAADYSHPVVRSASFLLTTVWNRIYRGVLVHHLDKLKQDAPGYEVVYVPSHRSHMDYLLLSYLLYTHGVVPPHIFAGVNLNLPVIGSLLRKGGAFFARRSFRGNALYSAVFREYMAQLVAGGYSIEYFIEGGRSRTGRLLPPKGGSLAMTVRAFLRQPTRPVLFQPVYIGYEKIMEGRSYLDELSGKPKEKESIWQVLTGIPKVLRENYGQVVVNFGEPIRLGDVLAERAPEWDGTAISEEEKPQWLANTIDALAENIQINVNRAADVNPINLLALAVLSTPKHAMGEADLLAQIALSKTLLAEVPYSDRVTVTPHRPQEIVAHGEEIGVLARTAHPLGDVLHVDGDTAVLLSYFRNNVLHLFTATAWIACCFQHNRRMSLNTLLRIGRSLYPFMQAELFLPWSEDGFAEQVERTITVFVREGLLQQVSDDDGGILARNAGQSDEVFRLRALGHPLQQAFERYYIAISVLAKNGPGTLGAGELESLCHLAAQRLSLLYAPAAPEFFDKTLFRGFIRKLRDLKLVWPDENSKLVFDQRLDNWAKDAKTILGRELRHTIEKVSPEAAKQDAPAAQ